MRQRLRSLRGRLAPAALVLVVAAAWMVDGPSWLRLPTFAGEAAQEMADVVEGLPAAGEVLVAFDPDFGTYPEVRPTVRALLDELARRGVGLAFVSVTAEGRALALTELARLSRASGIGSVTDVGFVSGAEAALVDLAADVVDRHDAIVVVGGNDLGPRSWVEQVLPRIDTQPMVAVAPTVLLPEVRPYLRSGQLDAALLTPREGAAFRDVVGDDDGGGGPSVTALTAALVIAIGVLLHAFAGRTAAWLRSTRAREPA